MQASYMRACMHTYIYVPCFAVTAARPEAVANAIAALFPPKPLVPGFPFQEIAAPKPETPRPQAPNLYIPHSARPKLEATDT